MLDESSESEAECNTHPGSSSEEEDEGSELGSSGASSDDSDDEEVAATATESADDSFTWTEKPAATQKRFAFSGAPGRKLPVRDTSDALCYFRLFLTEDILNMMVTESNRYAHQLQSKADVKEKSRLKAWKDTDIDELLVFIALTLHHGIIQKPHLDMYWSKKPLLATPVVGSVMARNRYQLLLRCLHFVDNDTLSQTQYSNSSEKSFRKIQPFYDSLVKQFRTAYVPKQDIAIDESLMLWKGRLSMKQFNRLKRARFGVKTFELCESGSSYIWNSLVYLGLATQLDISPDTLKSSQIVLTLIKDLLQQGYCVYMDNYYTSPTLFRHLSVQGTDAVGTLRLIRKNVPNDIKKQIPRGSVVSRYSGRLLALKWKDKKDVSMLSTFHNDAVCTTVSKRGSQQQKPQVIADYNNHMGAVDQSDQMLVAYPSERKRHRVWYKKLFRHLVNQSVLNAYVLFSKDNPGRMTHLQFRISLIEQIVSFHMQAERNQRTGPRSRDEIGDVVRLTGRHFPRLIPATGKKTGPTRKCEVCCHRSRENGKKARTESRYYCQECDVALCVTPCFEVYHTERNY